MHFLISELAAARCSCGSVMLLSPYKIPCSPYPGMLYFLNEASRSTIVWTVNSTPKVQSLPYDLGSTEEMNDQACKSVFLELPVFPVRRQVTAVCNGGIKN